MMIASTQTVLPWLDWTCRFPDGERRPVLSRPGRSAGWLCLTVLICHYFLLHSIILLCTRVVKAEAVFPWKVVLAARPGPWPPISRCQLRSSLIDYCYPNPPCLALLSNRLVKMKDWVWIGRLDLPPVQRLLAYVVAAWPSPRFLTRIWSLLQLWLVGFDIGNHFAREHVLWSTSVGKKSNNARIRKQNWVIIKSNMTYIWLGYGSEGVQGWWQRREPSLHAKKEAWYRIA